MSSRDYKPSPSRSLPGPWKHGNIPVIGLIGGIGAGKSQVAARMAEIGGFVIDADTVGHSLLNQRPVRDQVLSQFGSAILAPEVEGEPQMIDRRALASIVFESTEARKTLESLMHPAMRRTFEKAISRTQRRGGVKAVILDAAILFEAEWDDLCDRFVFVDSPRELRLARVMETRGWNEETFASREATQIAIDRKRAVADMVVVNDGDLVALRSAIGGCWNDLLRAPKRAQTVRSAKEECSSDVAATAKATVTVTVTPHVPDDSED